MGATSRPFASVWGEAHLVSSNIKFLILNSQVHTFWISDQSRHMWKTLCLKFHINAEICTMGIHKKDFLPIYFAWLFTLPDQLSKIAIQFPKVMDFYFYCFLCLCCSKICPMPHLWMNIEGGGRCTSSCKVAPLPAWNMGPTPCLIHRGTASHWIQWAGGGGEWELR